MGWGDYTVACCVLRMGEWTIRWITSQGAVNPIEQGWIKKEGPLMNS